MELHRSHKGKLLGVLGNLERKFKNWEVCDKRFFSPPRKKGGACEFLTLQLIQV